MTRIVGQKGTRRRRWTSLLPVIVLGAAALVLTLGASAGTIGTAAGFEDDDGNLVVNSTFDWNGFSPVTWTGTAPYQQADKTTSGLTPTSRNGWIFTGLTDAQATTSDTGFAGGTKQDDNCASVIGSKAPNKDDLKRIYVAHKQVNGHIYLELAWVRIPQNTTSPSAHVAFEFNQGTAACPAQGSPLVQRTAGDMLIVYDFEGGSTDVPTLTVRRWLGANSNLACDVGSDSPPCWGVAQNLSASGFAEAKVNTTASACDALAPGSNGCTGNSPTETLGLNEFGEAGIDLTAAGIFTSSQCTSFGKVQGVSRTSGNSGTAQMSDLVGPGSVRISNCGSLTVKKVTDPSPDPTNTSFSFTLNGSNPPNTSLPKTFSLSNGGTNTTQVFAATNYSVAETVPSNWQLTSASCDNGSGSLSSSTLSSISVAADESVTCTFNDKLLRGAISIHKVDTKGNAVSGASFTATASDGTTVYNFSSTTDSSGNACVGNLPFDTYTVAESSAPSGYAKDAASQQVIVNSAGTCSSGATAAGSNFVDTPLSNIQVNFKDGGSGKTSATLSCNNSTGTTSTTAATGWDSSVTVTGVKIDPSPKTVTCTIVIDP